MKAKVLLVEDEREIGELIGLYLSKDGIDFRHFETGEDGIAAFREEAFDLVVLDLNLPGMDGYEVLKKIREKSSIPVVIVSARQDDAAIVLGLGIGADDFVVKPFSPKILVARVRAHLRRYLEGGGKRNLVTFGLFVFDLDGYILKRGEDRVALSPKEYDILSLLVRNPGKPRRPEEIYELVWGNRYGDVSTVSVHIQRLRRKIEADPAAPRFIKTVHGFGYRFDPEGLP